MFPSPLIIVFEHDRSVFASLQFALTLEGYRVADGDSQAVDVRSAACVIIEQRYGRGDGLSMLVRLRARGLQAPVILLATNPTRTTKARADAAGAVLIEKPLLDDGLTQALRRRLPACPNSTQTSPLSLPRIQPES